MPQEVTSLTPLEEALFKKWITENNISDLDSPESFYDYRGYWKDIASKGGNATQMFPDGLHFTDQYKQHGHPTFSVESQYSNDSNDGGRWSGDTYIPQLATSRRNVDPEQLHNSLLYMLLNREHQ